MKHCQYCLNLLCFASLLLDEDESVHVLNEFEDEAEA